MRVLTMRAPTRMDFGGGWTDVPPYSDIEGGVVCSVAISRYAVAHIGEDATAASHDDPLVDAAVRRSGLGGQVRVSLRSHFPTCAGLGGSSASSAAVLGALDIWR